MKYEWRKIDKALYLPKEEPVIIQIPKMNFIVISGIGAPGNPQFNECITALYSISYGIKMTLKKEESVANYVDYTVFPLEGIWDLNEEGRKLYKNGINIKELKEHMSYKLMIRQPEFVSISFFNDIQSLVYKKKKDPTVLKTRYETIEEGLVCQMMHIGSYDDEPSTFSIMEDYTTNNGYDRISKIHKEIYISDARKVDQSKLKTTLRFKIEKTI